MAWRHAIVVIVVAGCKGFFDPHGGNWDATPYDAPTTPTVVNMRVADSVTNTVTTAPFTIGAGDLVIVGIIGDQGGDKVVSMQDTLGNLYVATGPNPATSNHEAEIWYAANTIAGTTTVTATMNYAYEEKLWLLEVSGMDLVAPLDATATDTTASNPGDLSGAAVTTSVADELVFVTIAAESEDVTTLVAGDPFTAMPTTQGASAAYLIAPVPGTYMPTWQTTDSGTPARCSIGASFKPAR
jgi:hypothetical protein